MVGGLGPSIREGEILAAKYRLERELGRGAMGTVWAATHLTLCQPVAIKFIAAEYADSLEARLRFRTEARAAAHLKSRYVVQVYDDGETMEGTPYIVMQYLEGETLEQRLEREGSIPLHDAVRITGHVARALRKAHARGIVHRDLKPANIFLCRSDEDEHGWIAKVLDFGVAKTEGLGERATTKPGAMLGTPLFMSPEQVQRASQVDHRADLYSLGMVFFTMLTGRHAFERDSFAGVLVAICSEPLPSLVTFAPGTPSAVVRWFERCCARERDERFQNAEQAFAALRSAAADLGPGGEAAGGHDGTLRGHRAPMSRRNPPLGTADSASYSGTDASQRPPATHARSPWVAVLVALAGLAALAFGAVLLLKQLTQRQPSGTPADDAPHAALAPDPVSPPAAPSVAAPPEPSVTAPPEPVPVPSVAVPPAPPSETSASASADERARPPPAAPVLSEPRSSPAVPAVATPPPPSSAAPAAPKRSAARTPDLGF